ncbi:MAG: bacillithiol biosynthesis cysteine-adding enzyme BshC [Planctomycetes bacterium]|nr:bacillithiol biosynthesis cysteine-adding enzyme BshC [Planctomycetota bacterium]
MRPLDHSHLDGGIELGRRYITDFARVESFYAGDYRRPEHLASLANRILNRTWKPRFDRAATGDLLQAYAERHPTPHASLANIEKLRDPQSVCVVTGQQAGLGGGPLYSLYKAVTAIRLARDVERASGQPCIPIFWNASDDSDIGEINRIRSVDNTGNLRKFRFPIDAGRRHVRDILLPEHGDDSWRAAGDALGEGPYIERAITMLRDGAGRDFGTAFTRLLLELLGSRGLVVIEPWALVEHPAWKRLCVQEIDKREERRLALQRVAERLEALGLPAGVPITNHLNLFKTVDGERRHVTTEGKRLIVDGSDEHVSKTALMAEVRAEPALFTPNVLLRPLIQNAIFPTVAYVGGQGEIAYHALLKGLHRTSKVFMPALFPRISMTLVDPKDARDFDKAVQYRKRLRWRQREAAIVYEDAQSGVRRAISELKENLAGLAKPLDQDLQKFEQRTLRSVGDVMTRVKYEPLAITEGGSEMEPLLNRYFPEDKPQERVITILAAYARHGPRLLEAVESTPEIFDFHHHIAVL